MKTLTVQFLGRLGNQMFIYAHGRALCERFGYEFCPPPWIGDLLFDLPETKRLKPGDADRTMATAQYQDQASLIYTRKQVRQWFKWRQDVLDILLNMNTPEVVFNVRLGIDHIKAGFVVIKPDSYEAVAERLGYDVEKVHWEVDQNPTRFDPCVDPAPSFYVLQQAKILIRAPSTFSWWAATLGNGRVFAPVVKGKNGGLPAEDCEFVEGNWPLVAEREPNTDLHLAEE